MMNDAPPVKLGLVDDHILFRKGLRSLIEIINPEYEILFEADNGKDLQSKISEKAKPDIILMDVNMPEMDGFETVEWLNNHHPTVKVLVVSMIEREEVIVKMLKLGVKGYLCKDIEPNELKNALQAIISQDFYYTDFITGKLVHSLQNEGNHNERGIKFDQMNDREKEFIQLACTELTYLQIAEKMFLSHKTIDGYRSSLFDKLNVKSRVGLAMLAVKNQWVEL